MRLFHHRILCLLAAAVILTLAATSHAQTEPLNYKDMDIPIMDGATDITDEWNEDFYTRTVEYRLEVKREEEVLEFYRNYFEGNGWSMAKDEFIDKYDQLLFPKNDWEAYLISTVSGYPFMIYVYNWGRSDLPYGAVLRLKYNDYSEEKKTFQSTILVTISPNIYGFSFHNPENDFDHLLEANPENIFIIMKAFGDALHANATLDPLKFDPSTIPEAYKDKEIVKAYVKMFEKHKSQFKDFGKKYFPETTQNAQ